MAKESEKKEKPKPIYYDVVMEVITPVTVTYRVLAESPEKALEMAKSGRIGPTKVTPPRDFRRAISAAVFLAGYSVKLLTKHF